MNSQDYENLLRESFGHLQEGRFRMGLKSAEKLYSINPDDERAICCLAWGKLENGFPEAAVTLADEAVSSSEFDQNSRYYRGFILFRTGVFESALLDLDIVLLNDRSNYNALLLKARILAAACRLEDASAIIDSILHLQITPEAEFIKELITLSASYNNKIFSRTASKKDILLEKASEALKKKEFWFVLWASREIIKDRKYSSLYKDARLLELEALLQMFQYNEAFETAEKIKNEFDDDKNFNLLYRRILKHYGDSDFHTAGKTELFENNYFTVNRIRCFDYLRSLDRKKREYLSQFNQNEIRYIGVEVNLSNPFYSNKDIDVEGTAIWYLNDIESGRYKFNIRVKKEWSVFEFIQSWGTDEPVFWKKGSGKVLIMMDGSPLCAKSFTIKDFEIAEKQEEILLQPESAETAPAKIDNEGDMESVEDLLKDLNSFTGLQSVKQSLWDFVTYLRFLNERKKHGLKTTGEFSVHCVFTGNPGTGKTTIARKLGKIFKAMGLLKSGHIIEADRSALVGQYIGETAQKTERLITEASGGILFIDEAYTLSKTGTNQDFGQEAVDIILKRMEDKKDDFVVIAAGYPKGMQDFINSNPGLKSRFSHFFHFEDYTPDELISIFRQFASEEDYIITDDAVELLKKEFIQLYRRRDQSFGNARIAKKYLNEIKLNVSRRISESGTDLSREAFTLITKEDIINTFSYSGRKNLVYDIDEEKLKILLEKLESLTGLQSVKQEINELVKLTRYYIENGEDPQKNISGHLVFVGNPGTGKTTVARLLSEIYSALGILPKGHLVEVDRQSLVGQYVGQTAIKTKEVIDSAIGGTLFIDEVYSLLKKDESDFGRESIDTLIKRMEDDKGKFILIAAGYTEETNNFLGMNPGLSSRFYKTIRFEDYSTDELYTIALKFLEEKKFKPDTESEVILKNYFSEAYKARDKKFGNARFVRNLTDKIIRHHLLYMASLNRTNRENENKGIISASVIKEVIKNSIDKTFHSDSEPEYLLRDLNELTGLTEVKKTAAKLIGSIKVAGLREKRGLKSVPRLLHSVFSGNPGTGKSTTAEMLGMIFKEMGILSSGHIVTANKLNLSAPYLGQSKQKTQELISKAKGGILYIEDAEFFDSDFLQGSEILDALMESLAAGEDDLIYVLSGNRKDFQDTVRNNPVLSRYFVNFFCFDDFGSRELVEIAYNLADKNSYRFDEGALQLLMDLFTELQRKNLTKDNGKLVKDIFYKAISAQEERLFNLIDPSDDELTTLIFDDVKRVSSEYFTD